ncbi:MAG: Ig-like domain-containing protein [bacterium]|nr:Ig-like domain-containing protein [bacterium]
MNSNTKKKIIAITIVIISLILIFVGYMLSKGSSSEIEGNSHNVAVSNTVVISDFDKLLYVGDSKTLSATVKSNNNQSITWQSSNSSVATISSKGVLVAKKAGGTKITAKTNDGKSSTVLVKVVDKSEPVPKPVLSNLKVYKDISLYAVYGPYKGEKEKLQQFAITNISKSNELVWYSYHTSDEAKDNYSTHIVAYDKNNNIKFKGYFENAGHGQSFDVSVINNEYYLYTGSHSSSGTALGAAAKKVTLSDSLFKKKSNERGIEFGYTNEVSFDENLELLAVKKKSNPYVLTMYRYNGISQLSNSSLSQLKTIKMVKDGANNGSDFYDNYIYYVDGTEDFAIRCYDVVSGEQVWTASLNNVRSKITKLCKNCTGSNYEIEGIKIYKYKGKNRIFIGYKGGNQSHSMILYFDY